MSDAHIDSNRKETRRTLLVALGLAVSFLLWGLAIYFVTGNKTLSAWDFGAVPDVPGLSVYSTVADRPWSAVMPYNLREKAELSPQHVQDRPGRQDTNKRESTP